jgi:hypothetical protein
MAFPITLQDGARDCQFGLFNITESDVWISISCTIVYSILYVSATQTTPDIWCFGFHQSNFLLRVKLACSKFDWQEPTHQTSWTCLGCRNMKQAVKWWIKVSFEIQNSTINDILSTIILLIYKWNLCHRLKMFFLRKTILREELHVHVHVFLPSYMYHESNYYEYHIYVPLIFAVFLPFSFSFVLLIGPFLSCEMEIFFYCISKISQTVSTIVNS